MSPLSLLFSSDEETSRRLSQALRELELEVETCPEIFAAVEKLTSRSFDVIVADWDEGLEGTFLLKTSRELKSSRSAFAIAIANPSASAAARQAGAHLVLSKPIVAEQAKYALLTCDEFLSRMKTWLPKLGFQLAEEAALHASESDSRTAPAQVEPLAEPPARLPARVPRAAVGEPRPPAAPTFTVPDNGFANRARIQTLFSSPAKPASSRTKGGHRYRFFLHAAALAATFLSVGYVSSEPARSEAVAVSVTKICGRALEKTQAWLHTSGDEDEEIGSTSQVAQAQQPSLPRPRPKVRITPAGAALSGESPLPTGLQPALPSPVQPEQLADASRRPLIPDSLRSPVENTARSVTARVTPLLSALEPVSLSADFADKLLLQKVQPSYPDQALQAGLQGPVVLQAWIGRDGTIRDVKLIRGSLLLGQAAYRAVKQWRYKPYLLNGQAVETQTYVTVDFRLP